MTTTLPATFVLVHGAWHGGWCWERVAVPLREAGHRVYTPTLTGLGERDSEISRDITLSTHIHDIAELLEQENLDNVILVGHSYGGIVVSGVAEQLTPRIRQLVYLDAILLTDGQSPFSILPAGVADQRRQQAEDFSAGLAMPVPPPAAIGVQDPDDAAWLKAHCTPHPVSTYEDTFRLAGPLGSGLPVTYVAVSPEYPPLEASRALARSQPDWRYLTMIAGHDAMVTSPAEVTALLQEYAGQAGSGTH